ncbi:MAG TPA: hypothetical protein VES20_15165 [Bryobacteraceae bacterium]|nr:hypothetical protein [Bryobacteraceae bacterium]
MNFETSATRCYSEDEAAKKLGVTVPQLRAMIRKHIALSPLDPEAVLLDKDLIALKVLGRLSTSMVQ